MNAPAAIAVSPLPVAGSRRAFTLIELLVVFIIIAILAALSLTGLAGARQRAKIDKTKSTIRKIHEIVVPHYESFAEKRTRGPLVGSGSPSASAGFPYWAYVDSQSFRAYLKSKTNSWTGPATTTATTLAQSRLDLLRVQQVLDLPDQWADVGTPTPGSTPSAAARRYAVFKSSVGPSELHQAAECLAMIVTRGGFAADATENFRTDEMGDVDKDGAPEFLDAWGKPIAFIRWPSGYVAGATNWQFAGRIPATQQIADSTTAPDPLDPQKLSGDFNLTPLIYSGGPDEAPEDVADASRQGYGLIGSSAVAATGWLSFGVTTTCPPSPRAGDINTIFPLATRAVRDNITNHDLITK